MMRAIWEMTEQIVVLAGLALIAIQICFILEFYILAGFVIALMTLAGGVLMIQFYSKKSR